MLDIGFSELLVIGGVALVVLGPEKLAVVARTAGKWSGKAQRYVNDVKADIAREGELAELRTLKAQMESAGRDIGGSLRAMQTSVQHDLTALEGDFKSGVDTAIPTVQPSIENTPTFLDSGTALTNGGDTPLSNVISSEGRELSSEQIDAHIQASIDSANIANAPYTPPAVDMTGKYQAGLELTLSAPPLRPAPLNDPIAQRMALELLQDDMLRLEQRMVQLKRDLALSLAKGEPA